MERDIFAKVDQYYVDLLNMDDEVMRKIQENCVAAGLPRISISPPLGMMLEILVRSSRAKRILEVGTLGGYSGCWLARGLGEDGRLITLEFEKLHAEIAQKNFEIAGLEHKVEVINDDAAKAMQNFIDVDAEKFDVIFLDADKQSYPRYLRLALELSHQGTLIIADNVVRKGEVANSGCTDESVIGIRNFLDELARQGRVRTTAIQTVGSKGYDGFSLSIVL